MSLKSYFAKLNDRRTCPRINISQLQKFILILVLIVGSIAVVQTVRAQSTPATENVIKDQKAADQAGGSLTPWLGEALKGNAYQGLKGLVGEIPDDVLDGKIKLKPGAYIPSGVIGITNNMIASLYAPAGGVQGVQYIAQSFNNFLGKPAYAQSQGIGFAGLQPIQKLWSGFRNITYLLASIVFIMIGIMIMFRVKISPQAVITIQSAIPQVITTLILITFSYAIAGLLIDAMQFLQSATLAILFNVSGKGFGTNLLSYFGSNQILPHDYTFGSLSNADMNSIAGLTERAMPIAPFMVWAMIIGFTIGSFIQFGAGSAAGATIAVVIVALVVAIMLLVWMFQFYFGCLKCYITAIFKIIIGPLEIAAGAFPNSKMGFNSWIWDLIANLSVFPISVLFLVLGNMIIDAVNGVNGTNFWVPSIIGGASLQSGIVGIISLTNVVSIGIGLAIVAIMSKLPALIPQAIFALKPSPWEMAIGEGLSGFSKNGAIKAAKGIGYNLASEEVRNAGTGAERFPALGRIISKASGRVNPADPDMAQNAIADYLKNQGK